MARRHVDLAPVTALAHRRDEAAACLGVSVEVFDVIRPHLPAVRIGSVVVYPVAGLQSYLERHAATPTADLNANRKRRAA